MWKRVFTKLREQKIIFSVCVTSCKRLFSADGVLSFKTVTRWWFLCLHPSLHTPAAHKQIDSTVGENYSAVKQRNYWLKEEEPKQVTRHNSSMLMCDTHLVCCSRGCFCLLLSDSGTEMMPGQERRSFPSHWAGPCDWGWRCGSVSGRGHRAPPLCAGLVWRVPASNHTEGLWWSPRSQSWGI